MFSSLNKIFEGGQRYREWLIEGQSPFPRSKCSVNNTNYISLYKLTGSVSVCPEWFGKRLNQNGPG